MALDKLVDSSQLDADLLSVANAIRTKGGTSAALAFPAEFVSAIGDIPTGGGSSFASGSFSPTSNLRSITLTDCIGKSNILIYPITGIVTVSGGRTHWGELKIGGVNKVNGSTNSSGSGWTFTTSSASSYDSTTGTVTITSGVTANYGGYYAVGMTYGYIAW